MMTLSALNLSVTVGNRALLQPTDLALKRGELTTIVGPNGAGKSTLVRALIGLAKHDGHVQLDEESLDTLRPKDRAKRIAYLPQGQNHAWPLSVEAVVALGRYPHGDAKGQRPDEVVDYLIDSMGLSTLRQRSVLTLSGGEQMRVAVARALAVQADFLLTDEPLASLDPRYQFEIMNRLASEAREGCGVVVVMHDLSLAARYADRVLLMHRGAIVADGPATEVLRDDLVGKAFGVRCIPTDIDRHDGVISVALPDGIA